MLPTKIKLPFGFHLQVGRVQQSGRAASLPATHSPAHPFPVCVAFVACCPDFTPMLCPLGQHQANWLLSVDRQHVQDSFENAWNRDLLMVCGLRVDLAETTCAMHA